MPHQCPKREEADALRHLGLHFEQRVAPLLPYRAWRAIEGALLALPLGPQTISRADRTVPNSILLCAIGDILLDPKELRHVRPRLGSRLRSLLQTADLRVANLEAQFSEHARPVEGTGLRLRANPEDLWVLSELQIDAVTCANNHVLDYGSHGVLESLVHLEKTGIQACGVGIARGDERKPTVLQVRDLSIAMFGYCDDWLIPPSGITDLLPASVADDDVIEDVRAARTTADLVVVQLHWGYEYVIHPWVDHRDRARRFVEAGADLVLCHHAHVPMGFERYGRSIIAYGLGNFIAGYSRRRTHPWTGIGVVLMVSMGKEGAGEMRLVPMGVSSNGLVEIVRGSAAAALCAALQRASSRICDSVFLCRIQDSRMYREGLRSAAQLIEDLDDPELYAEHWQCLQLPRQRRLATLLAASHDSRHRTVAHVLGSVSCLHADESRKWLRGWEYRSDVLREWASHPRAPLGRLP